MSEWIEYELGTIIDLIGGGTPKTNVTEYWGGNINWLSVVDFNNGKKYVFDTEKKITESGLKNSSTKLLNKNDIIISARGTVGAIAMLGKEMTFNQSCYGVRGKEKYLDQDYLYYLLKDSVNNLLQISHGGVFDTITKETFNNIKILLPLIPEQKAISNVLNGLDNKIELFNLQIVIIEKMMATLFRHWFEENANDNWKKKSLSSIATFLNGLACQKFPPKNEIDKLPVLKIKELSNGISESSDWASTDVKDEYIVHNGDVIFAWSASLMVKIWNGGDCILNQHLFKVSSNEYPKWFYYMWCKHHLDEFLAIAESHATTMGHIKRGDLDEAKVLIPSDEELEAMSEQMEPLIDKIIANNKQITSLTKLRDTLLPKLMSGEIRVNLTTN
jgi:type I restriction enzyme S subunit